MNTKNQQTIQYDGFDLFKLISSVLVIVLHATETSNVYALGFQYVCTRFCVPFFFICSGFLFGIGLDRAIDKRAYFIKHEKRLLMMFLFYSALIAGPITVIDYFRSNPDASILTLVLVIFRRLFVIGTGAYWYLVSLIWATAFVYFCYSKKWNGFLAISMVIGFILQIGYTSFGGIISNIPVWNLVNRLIYFVFSWELNFVTTGIPFFAIGYFIHIRGYIMKKSKALIGIVLFTLLRLVEYILPLVSNGGFWSENTVSIAFIPQAIMVFFFAYHCKGLPKYSKIMRQTSTFIYLTHWIILYDILNPILSTYFNVNIFDHRTIILKTAITLAICLGLNFALRRINNKTVRILIGG